MKEIPFRISFPETRINLKESKPTMDEISGLWSEVYPSIFQILRQFRNPQRKASDLGPAIAEMIRVASSSAYSMSERSMRE